MLNWFSALINVLGADCSAYLAKMKLMWQLLEMVVKGAINNFTAKLHDFNIVQFIEARLHHFLLNSHKKKRWYI